MNFARTGTIAVAAVLVALMPSAALAGSYKHSDASGDVSKVGFGTGGVSQSKDPTKAEGDILSTATLHGARRVTMAVHYRELSETGNGVVHEFRIGTNKGRIREVGLIAQPGTWGGRKVFVNGKGKRVGCKGIRWSIQYDTNAVQVSVPRRCLGHPRWVHVGIGSISGDDKTLFLDDANTTDSIGENPKWGPRVFR